MIARRFDAVTLVGVQCLAFHETQLPLVHAVITRAITAAINAMSKAECELARLTALRAGAMAIAPHGDTAALDHLSDYAIDCSVVLEFFLASPSPSIRNCGAAGDSAR